jgi:hypothetical protein
MKCNKKLSSQPNIKGASVILKNQKKFTFNPKSIHTGQKKTGSKMS